MLTQIFVNEKNYTKVAKFVLFDVKLLLNIGAEINYSVCDDNGGTIKSDSYVLTENEFSNWGNDDMYIVNLILTKEGLTSIA